LDRNVISIERGVGTEKIQAARALAERHYLVEPGLTHVFRVRSSEERELAGSEPIKVLEVNEDTVPAGILPVHFGPTLAIGVPFSSIIIEITPDEYEQLLASKLKLPNGWVIGEEMPRPNGSGGE